MTVGTPSCTPSPVSTGANPTKKKKKKKTVKTLSEGIYWHQWTSPFGDSAAISLFFFILIYIHKIIHVNVIKWFYRWHHGNICFSNFEDLYFQDFIWLYFNYINLKLKMDGQAGSCSSTPLLVTKKIKTIWAIWSRKSTMGKQI
jgi:hypothetical protein